MIATLPAQLVFTGKVKANRKEKAFYREYAVISLDANDRTALAESPDIPRCYPIVTARLYATDVRNYACIWVSSYGRATPEGQPKDRQIYLNGGGHADGYGYHKASAAMGAAISDCGIKLDEDIEGRGDSAIERAVMAIGRAVAGKDEKLIFHTAGS